MRQDSTHLDWQTPSRSADQSTHQLVEQGIRSRRRRRRKRHQEGISRETRDREEEEAGSRSSEKKHRFAHPGKRLAGYIGQARKGQSQAESERENSRTSQQKGSQAEN